MSVWVLRLIVVLAILTAIYVMLGWYLRWSRVQRLRGEYRGGARTFLSESDYIARGLAEYDRSLRKHLLLLVYVIPVVIVLLLFVVGNYM